MRIGWSRLDDEQWLERSGRVERIDVGVDGIERHVQHEQHQQHEQLERRRDVVRGCGRFLSERQRLRPGLLRGQRRALVPAGRRW
jgi:hypothetical protein